MPSTTATSTSWVMVRPIRSANALTRMVPMPRDEEIATLARPANGMKTARARRSSWATPTWPGLISPAIWWEKTSSTADISTPVVQTTRLAVRR